MPPPNYGANYFSLLETTVPAKRNSSFIGEKPMVSSNWNYSFKRMKLKFHTLKLLVSRQDTTHKYEDNKLNN